LLLEQFPRATRSPHQLISASRFTLATMSFRKVLCLSLLAAVAAGGAESPGAQLRGSAAAPAPAAALPDVTAEGEEEGQHLQCSCSQAGECECSNASIVSAVQAREEDEELKQALLDQTRELHAWWLANVDHPEQTACSCVMGNETCHCESASPSAEAPMLNATEQPLSLWWAGGYRRWGGWRRGWWGGGGCRGFRGGGCGCHWAGCRCGGARGGACGGWR